MVAQAAAGIHSCLYVHSTVRNFAFIVLHGMYMAGVLVSQRARQRNYMNKLIVLLNVQ